MNIFDHLIPDSAILGVGPLFIQATDTVQPFHLAGRRRYVFDLHLSAHTTEIRSDWFETRDDPEEKKKMKMWEERYNSIRETVAVLIGEVTDQRTAHLEQVHLVHENSVNTLESLLKDLQPALPIPALANSINLKTQRMMDDLLELKMLATK